MGCGCVVREHVLGMHVYVGLCMCVCVCACVCMNACTWTYMCALVCLYEGCTCTHVGVCMHGSLACTHVRVCAHTQLAAHVCDSHMCLHMHGSVQAHTWTAWQFSVHTHVCMCAHSRAPCAHTCAFMHMWSPMHTCMPPCASLYSHKREGGSDCTSSVKFLSCLCASELMFQGRKQQSRKMS